MSLQPDGALPGLEEEAAHLRREVARLSLFHEVGKELASSLDLDRILFVSLAEAVDQLMRQIRSLPRGEPESALEQIFRLASHDHSVAGTADVVSPSLRENSRV